MDTGPSNPLCSCPKYGAWSTKRRAEERLREIRVQNERSGPEVKVPVRVYQCRSGVYHLTSLPLMEKEE